MATQPPPPEVALTFLATLNQTVELFEETLVPVLRGSLLLHHWFGDAARPAADLDLECFARPRAVSPQEDEDEEEWHGDGFGHYGEYESLVDFGKAMCRYAANESRSYQWRSAAPEPTVEFQPVHEPEGGASLWVYGTPGERYFAGWVWHANDGQTGQLQIDIAAGGYALDAIDTTTIKLHAANGSAVQCPAYTPETLLAAKVSWLVRSFERKKEGIEWKGEPKDLFDAHLLLTQSKLKPKRFQKSLLAIGAQDTLEWNNLDVLLSAGHALADTDFANWSAFHKKHQELDPCGPTEMLREIAARLEPLLGDFYRREEMPFLKAINTGAPDELAHLVYADWLDENGHADRGTLLRHLAAFIFRDDELPHPKRTATRAAILAALPEASYPWLCQLLGSSARVAGLREQVEGRKV